MTAAPTTGGTEAALRRGLLAVAALSIAGTAVELAMLRHWGTVVQLIPWAVLALLAAGVGLLLRPTRRRVMAVRAMALVASGTALFGVYEHVLANFRAAPLDARYSNTWATMSFTARWWASATKSVGPAPPIAAAVLAQAAICLAFATAGHPALRRGEARVRATVPRNLTGDSLPIQRQGTA